MLDDAKELLPCERAGLHGQFANADPMFCLPAQGVLH